MCRLYASSQSCRICSRSYGRFDALREQHALLQSSNVGWGSKDFPDLQVSVVGGRPLTSGGPSMEKKASMYRDLWGVESAKASAAIISQHIDAAPASHAVIVLGHNGPYGLGALRNSPCGKDWGEPSDWGDRDLTEGLRACHRQVPLVVFGHMHDSLQGGGKRTMVHVAEDGAVYVNSARVPRWRVSSAEETMQVMERAFTMIELTPGSTAVTQSVDAVWVRPCGRETERQLLFSSDSRGVA
mmetsp:Transcript_15415/g.39725  ORF Transcript_15415/g.39725 Transcript_15415/m.39725 type:complete len:242 (-) Transcript_15415:282-1007(-)